MPEYITSTQLEAAARRLIDDVRYNALTPLEQQALQHYIHVLQDNDFSDWQIQYQSQDFRTLINDGRLTEELLDQLSALINSSVHPDLDPNVILQDLLKELADPVNISQRERNTCAATVGQISLALWDPERYVALVKGLVSTDGLVDHQALDIEHPINRDQDSLQSDKSDRSITSRLIQAAFMEFANGEKLNYDNHSDAHFTQSWIVSAEKTEKQGLQAEEVGQLFVNLYGREGFKTVGGEGDELLEQAKPFLKDGTVVPVILRWQDAAHAVILTAVDESQNRAYFINPWGEANYIPLDELKQRLQFTIVPGIAPLVDVSPFVSAANVLPGQADNLLNYQALDGFRYLSNTEYIDKNSAFISLTQDQKAILAESLSYIEDRSLVHRLSEIIDNGPLTNGLINHLSVAKTDIDYQQVMDIYSLLDEKVTSGNLSLQNAQEILSIQPATNLTSIIFKILMRDIESLQGNEVMTSSTAGRDIMQHIRWDGERRLLEWSEGHQNQDIQQYLGFISSETLHTFSVDALKQSVENLLDGYTGAGEAKTVLQLIEAISDHQLGGVLRDEKLHGELTSLLGAVDNQDLIERLERLNGSSGVVTDSPLAGLSGLHQSTAVEWRLQQFIVETGANFYELKDTAQADLRTAFSEACLDVTDPEQQRKLFIELADKAGISFDQESAAQVLGTEVSGPAL